MHLAGWLLKTDLLPVCILGSFVQQLPVQRVVTVGTRALNGLRTHKKRPQSLDLQQIPEYSLVGPHCTVSELKGLKMPVDCCLAKISGKGLALYLCVFECLSHAFLHMTAVPAGKRPL